ncbi:MAG: N-formylglutamate amidohydrolase [Caulobacteraceae bacterium]
MTIPKGADGAKEEARSAFRIALPPAGAPLTPLVFASPHSGRFYPPGLRARLAGPALRSSEDALVDELIASAPEHGARLIAANFARVYLDLNREPWELDPAMFEDEIPDWARARTAKVAAGLGSIARVVRDGEEVYARKLSFDEARQRIESVHRPYHAALATLLANTAAEAGLAILLDWHSMPSAAVKPRDDCEVVIGDRFGASASAGVTRRIEAAFAELGFRAARNAPFAGGYTTQNYGAPRRGVHAVQIEISRALYLDESRVEKNAGFEALKSRLEALFAGLAGSDWRSLAR